MAGDELIRFTLEEVLAIVGDLMRVADELRSQGDDVNAFLIDLVVNRVLDRTFDGDD